MQQPLQLYFDINELTYSPEVVALDLFLQNNPSVVIQAYHPYQLMRVNYIKLLNSQISLEEFLSTGDITSNQPLPMLDKPLLAASTIAALPAPQNTCFIITPEAAIHYEHLHPGGIASLQASLEKAGSRLFVV